MNVRRIFVEKIKGMDVAAQAAAADFRNNLGIAGLKGVRLLNRYDVEGISDAEYEAAKTLVFSEPNVDRVYDEVFPCPPGAVLFAVEYLPGQYDQRADSAAQCIQILTQKDRPEVRAAQLYVLEGEALTENDVEKIKAYCINPVESREASAEKPETLRMQLELPERVETLNGFTALSDEEIIRMRRDMGLAMSAEDLLFCRKYFKETEHRDPTVTEIRVIDTYWSDHCRHTTFLTKLNQIRFAPGEENERVRAAFEEYLDVRREVYGTAADSRDITLMDAATIAAKYLKKKGLLADLDESEEINACSVKIKADIGGEEQDWLLMFKNETHNHPTEIEPFGGAATCLGGAIRDPLSGRSYVYQAMRVTGSADPRTPVSQTLRGKLSQRKITTGAAAGYSSYGNQIGLATGHVREIYHPGYLAKRMEIGAVIAAAPSENVVRQRPEAGDIVILLGGRTGRDGIGGATGSSKEHTVESVTTCGSEVQKGNPPTERKLQRLFRNPEASRRIKRCNDFGAGGVSVAVGELADGLYVDLDTVTKKYDGLDGTELAISESQERMACAVADGDVEEFMGYAAEENLEATVIAEVTAEPRMRMAWNGVAIVDLSREFLNSNGAPKHQVAHVCARSVWQPSWAGTTLAERMTSLVTDLNVASNKGLSERFDSTIGAATVLMPFGGKTQLTPSSAMVAKFPVDGETTTASAMAWGFNPYLMEADQFAGAYLSVVESIAKLVAAGFEHKRAYLSFQEYFERLRTEAERWGKPTAAVLGALMAQVDLGAGAIGGKDSMSGSFEDETGELNVPPTLISFAVAVGKAARAVSPEFKGLTHRVVRIAPATYGEDYRPDAQQLLAAFDAVEALTATGNALAISTPGYGCGAESLFKMCVGNQIGIELAEDVDVESLFTPLYGSFIVELAEDAELPEVADGVVVEPLGTTVEGYVIDTGSEVIELAELQEAWESGIEGVFAYRSAGETPEVETIDFRAKDIHVYGGAKIARPRVIIPVFPGNNCEYDSARAFRAAGAEADTFVINNLTPEAVAESTHELARRIRASQIVMIPGGFSGGDEPDGSAKFITAFFRAPEVTEAVRDLLKARDGLMLGICNGFQALIKLGLVPYGDIVDATPDAPTLTFNTIGRHQSRLVRTRISSNLSPWLSQCSLDDPYTVAISHGEGRFVANDEVLAQLIANGQVATQYVGENGKPSMDLSVNPNGSALAIEGITSPDGRVLGKMGHAERRGDNLYRNVPEHVPGDKFMPIFESGVAYFA